MQQNGARQLAPRSHPRRVGLPSCVAPRATGRFADLRDFQSCYDDLRKGCASSVNFNCLLSSLAQLAGRLHPQHFEQDAVHKALQVWRQRQHDALVSKLQETAPPAGAPRWDANLSRAGADLIFRNNLFLQSAHISCAAAELERAILLLQPAGGECGDQPQMASKCGSGHLTATLYPPNFAMPRLDLKKAAVAAALGEQPPPFVLFLGGGHYSPLLTRAQRTATPFPPRELMKLLAHS